MKDSRSKNTVRNIGMGLINKVVSIVLPFINRTAILYILGAEFTGLNGLFSSILEVLNIAELGFHSAIVYSMYKPIAEGNTIRVNELLTLYKKIYHVVGLVILSAGIVILPFITYFISGSYPDSINIYFLYLLYLINSSLSYFLYAYKESILLADQRQDLSHLVRTATLLLQYILQFLVIIITKNYYYFMFVTIGMTLVTNIGIKILTDKKYKEYRTVPYKIEMSKDIKQQVTGLLLDNICDKTRNSFDNIIISTYLGLTAVAIYTNYFYIFVALYGIMLVLANSMSASVGNSIAKESVEKNYFDLLKFSLIFAWISGWCAVTLLCIYQPFMKLWVGEKLILPFLDVILFGIYFYVINANNIRNQYISGTGIWWKLKKTYIIEAFSNLILNIILGKYFGISGVLIATIITIVLFNFIWRTIILFESYFKNFKVWNYFKCHIYYLLAVAVTFVLTFFICSFIKGNLIIVIVIRLLVCITICSPILLLLLKRDHAYNYAKAFLFELINRRFKNIKY